MPAHPQTGAVAEAPTGRSFAYVTSIFAALGGLLFGYYTGVISGAALLFSKDFTLSIFALEVIVSGVLVGAAVGAAEPSLYERMSGDALCRRSFRNTGRSSSGCSRR